MTQKWFLRIIYIFCLLSLTKAYSQPLNGKLLIHTNIPVKTDSLVLEVMDESTGKVLFKKTIDNHSVSSFDIKDQEPLWLMVYLKENSRVKAAAGRFFMKEKESVKVYLNGFFEKADIKGGENTFIDENRYLLFDVPLSIGKAKEFSFNNLRKSRTFTPKDPNLYIRYEEFKNNALKTIKEYSNYNFTLTSLWEKRQNFPLDFLDSCRSFFSPRIKSTKDWAKLNQYIVNELTLTKNIIDESIVIQDAKGAESNFFDICTLHDFTFVDFWASWCIPCIKEFPELKELFSKSDQGRIGFVSISIDKSKDDWLVSNTKQNFPWPTFLDHTRDIFNKFDLTYIPQGLIVDKSGKIIQRFVTMEQLTAFLKSQKLIKESK
jgi:thiol-disulfide isomerase/thioredoxin